MPKKRNFLGGMQNYNAQTGEYEPALKGPNGESPSGFKSFKKQEEKDESFDTVNKKRMGKDIDFTSEDYVDDFYDRVSDLQKEINTSGIDDDEYDAEINKLKEELETKKDSMSEDDYNKAKEMLDRFSRPTDDDFDANDEDSIWNAFESGKITEEERNKMLSKRSGKIANESFDETNAKRMGKETKSIDKELEKAKKRVYKFMPDLPSKKAMVSEMEGLLARFKSGNRPEEMLKTAKDNIQKWQRSRELDTNDLRDERLAYFEKIVDYMERNL